MLKRVFLLLMILSLGICPSLFADMSDKATLGGQDSSGNYHWRVNSSGHFIPGTDDQNNIGGSSNTINDFYISGMTYHGASAGETVSYEIFTTGDTLVAADSGKILITNLLDVDGIIDFVLPAATTAGLKYTFVTGNKSIIRIDPAAATANDQILYAALERGDRIGSGTAASADGVSGDSIILVSTGTGWAVVSMNPDDGSWADAN